MKTIFFLSFFLLVFFQAGLKAQQSFVIGVATQNTDYKFQRWKTSSEFPENYIKEYQNQGFFVTSLQNYGNFWSVVLSRTSVINSQIYSRSIVFPDKFVQENLAKGFSITSIGYGSKEWVVVMSDKGKFKKEAQDYYYGLKYPKDEIKRAYDNGFIISRLQFSNDFWIVLFEKPSLQNENNLKKQEMITVKSFDDEGLKMMLNTGWLISDLTYKDGILLLLTKNLGWGRQDNRIVLYSNMSETISNWWSYKYAITNLVTIYDVILNISSADNSEYIKDAYTFNEKPESAEDKKFLDLIENNPDTEVAFRCLQKLAGIYIKEKDWVKSIGIYNKYRPKFPKFSKQIENIIDILNAEEEGVKIENLGPSVNSVFNDYFPIINLEGNKLYFCSFNRDDGYGGEDIYVSESDGSNWKPATNIGRQINSGSHEATLGVSGDNLELTVFGNYSESFGNGDIFYYTRTEDGWSKRKHYPQPINSIYFDSDMCFSSDGNAIFFVSDRPPENGDYAEKDNFSRGLWGGNLDIYVVTKTDSGWSEAINLGSTINTDYIDRSPYLHPDGKTLYFSSNGHYGIGGLDVYKATRTNTDSWTEWSEPVNLGKEINTSENDWGYKISLDGSYAYFSAFNLQDSSMKQDIYKVTLPKKARPDLVATIKGKVVDPDGNPLSAKIKWENLSTGVTIGELNSDPNDGSFFIVLPLGKKYGYYAEKEGYYPVSKNIDLTKNIKSMITIQENIVLIPIKQIKEKNLTVRINNLFFDFNSSKLLPESFPELNRLIKVLDEFPNVKIEISGHTDDVGSDSYNKKLSVERAKAVMNYLVEKGVKKALLIPKGYGKSRPVSKNKTDEERALNRRVEIKLIQ